jgi:hypothetical protein
LLIELARQVGPIFQAILDAKDDRAARNFPIQQAGPERAAARIHFAAKQIAVNLLDEELIQPGIKERTILERFKKGPGPTQPLFASPGPLPESQPTEKTV